jgi:arylsulfatase A-like enzyme
MKKKSLFILPAVLIVIIGVILLATSKRDKQDFNIILISIDTLRADHLGCYTYPKNTSPNIDRFRADSVLFRRCMAQSASTLPSHASIFTSLIPSHHSAYFTRNQSLPEEIRTMAEILRDKNYRTISFNEGGQVDAKFGLDQGFELYQSFSSGEQSFKHIVEHSIDWLNKNEGDKFFLFLHTYETHHPYTPKPEHLKLFETGYNGQLPTDISVELIHSINRGEVTLSEADKSHMVNTYDAEIRSMDESFQVLIDFLVKKNLYDNTLIIFTSDHGEEFGEHGMWGIHSNSLFNEQLHVPLIMKLPRSNYANRKVNQRVRSIDILPTVMDMLGEDLPVLWEGISLVPLIKGKKLKNEIIVISQLDDKETFVPRAWTVFYKKFKLFDLKLYNLLRDPAEQVDIASQYKPMIKKLNNYVTDFINKNIPGLSTRKIKLDDALKEKLKSLGYLN